MNSSKCKMTLIAAAAAAIFGAQAGSAPAAQISDRFVVATAAAGSAELSDPSVAVSSKGVAVGWTLHDMLRFGTAHLGTFALNGAPVAADIEVGQTLNNPPGVAMDPDGDVAVSWDQPDSNQSYFNSTGALYAKRYSIGGAANGNAIRVTGTENSYLHVALNFSKVYSTPSKIAMDSKGNFAVGISESGYFSLGCAFVCSTEFDFSNSYAGTYRADGVALRRNARIDRLSPTANGGQTQLIGISLLGNGNVAALFNNWTQDIKSRPTIKVFNQRLAKARSVTLESSSNTIDNASFDANGNVYIVSHGDQCVLSRYAVNGGRMGSDILFAPGAYPCSVAAAPSGTFALVWQDSAGISGQFYNADGSAQGDPIVIEPNPNAYVLYSVSSALDDSGHLAVMWYYLDNSAAHVETIAGRTVTAP